MTFMASFKHNLKLVLWSLGQFGFEPQKFVRAIPRVIPYLITLFKFTKNYKGRISFVPCLHDRYAEAGVTKSEYFWQDLFIARLINEANPKIHVDVGSRTDGFVAHVASFRTIEVFDVRPITTAIPGVSFRQADIMDSASMNALKSSIFSDGLGYCDSLSCLHVLEHIGLGRYGDRIAPLGYKTGFYSLSKLLRPGGFLYLSTPIGEERVEFNANWIFNPFRILELANAHGLLLNKLFTFNSSTGLIEVENSTLEQSMIKLSRQHYNLGIFIFQKPL